MKTTIIILLLSIFSTSLYSTNPNCELYVNNRTDTTLYIKFYPSSSIYHAQVEAMDIIQRYSLRSQYYLPGHQTLTGVSRRFEPNTNLNRLHFLVGLDGFALNNRSPYPGFFELLNDYDSDYSKWLLLGQDEQHNSDLDGLFGYGKYILEGYYTTNSGQTFESAFQIPIDWMDFNYPYSQGGCEDLTLRIYSITPLEITFQWSSGPSADEIPLYGEGSPPMNGEIKVYKQYHSTNGSGQWVGYNLNNENPPSNGSPITDEIYLTYPIDGRNLPSPYTIPEHLNSGELRGNLLIDNNASTLTTLLDHPTEIKISNQSTFKIDASKTFTLVTPSTSFTNFVVEALSQLYLGSSSEFKINASTKLILKNNSHLSFAPNSRIFVMSGGYFCNEGAIVRGNGSIIYKAGTQHFACIPSGVDFAFNDSSKMVLDSNATVEIPDSTTIKFTGNHTSLILTPTSKLKLGMKSKIVLDSGARIIARNSTITSSDTTKLWDGIYSSGLSLDTISNCKIINSKNGINLTDKTDESGDYNVLITDCDFINKSTSFINTGVFAYNSDEILVSGNDFYGESSGGFYCGIYFLYCPSNEIVITDNNIEDSYVGIADFSSSAYIARNTLNGNSSYGYGIQLDNSEGIIESNMINNFEASINAYTASPFLIKNTFTDASTSTIMLECFAIPVMKPTVTGEITYWYGGNNTLSLGEYSSGISMYADSYPLINNGYNKFYLNDGTYFIEGEIPEELNDSIEAKNNYWNPSVSSNEFNISNCIVKYLPAENGTDSNRTTNTSQLVDIGFGLKDTIHIKDESDNPENAGLFASAINDEHIGNFEDAIASYKELVELNDNEYSGISIQRIYGCFEKLNFLNGNYGSVKTYFSSIYSDNDHDSVSRSIAKEMYLKTMFRNSELNSAHSEYNTMYLNNPNNGIGVHALLNRTIIEDLMSSDTTDNLYASAHLTNPEEHKQNIFAILNLKIQRGNENLDSKSKITDRYALNQNYPNPFNPVTTISFEIADYGHVNLGIYDITGREVVTLINELRQSGRYTVDFDGSNLSSGVYFCRMQAGKFIAVKKLLLIK